MTKHFRTMKSLRPHCDAGAAEMAMTYNGGSCGKDWKIRCPCGHQKRYAWVGMGFAIERWNEQEVTDDERTI